MKEKLYAIPVNDAFSSGCECPVCRMYKTLEDNAIEYTMGPSYMEDDTRMQTDEKGFCQKHMKMIYQSGNKLGISLILKTHMDRIIREAEPLSEKGTTVRKGLLGISAKSRSTESGTLDTPLAAHLKKINNSCFVCDRINNVFDRYIDTIFFLWQRDNEFRDKFRNCNGFCNVHATLLIEKAPSYLSQTALEEFCSLTKQLYLENMKRVRDDLAWFIDKFDYRNADEPWKNSKDSIPRAMIKLNCILPDDDQSP